MPKITELRINLKESDYVKLFPAEKEFFVKFKTIHYNWNCFNSKHDTIPYRLKRILSEGSDSNYSILELANLYEDIASLEEVIAKRDRNTKVIIEGEML